MYKIFIVEDDQVIAAAMAEHLKSWGWDARCAVNFGDVLAEFAAFGPQLVLLDISLPFYNGYHWCGQIRQCSKVPVIFISSAADNLNIVMAMNMGGDDFIAKPFDLDVLTAKVQAMLRRTYEFAGQSRLLEHRGAVFNVDDATLTIAGNKLPLTRNEQRILQTMLENKGRIVSRDHLMLRLWESDSYVDDNTLTVNITRLRRKLEQAGLPGFILTKKGSGYLID